MRLTSTTLPVSRWTPSSIVRAAATGSLCAARASRTAAPSRSARVSVAGTRPSASWSPRMTVSAHEIWQPSSTHTARAIRSAAWLSTASTMSVLPLSSASAIGELLTPIRPGSTICASGKARPIASPSTIGRPASAAHAMGSMELTPPTSMGAMCVAGRPMCFSSARRAASSSPPLGTRSRRTVGAPIPDTGTTVASGATSSMSTTRTGPCLRMASRARSLPMYGSPPPPVPRICGAAGDVVEVVQVDLTHVPSLRAAGFRCGAGRGRRPP